MSTCSTTALLRSLLLRRRQGWMQNCITNQMAPPLLPLTRLVSKKTRHGSRITGTTNNSNKNNNNNNNHHHYPWRERWRSKQEKLLKASPALRKTAENLVVYQRNRKDEPSQLQQQPKQQQQQEPIKTAATVGRRMLQQVQTIPNMLTLSRIVSAPCISYWIITDQITVAGVACLLAAATDVADGWIAKTWPATQKTALGTYLDPMADKILINAVAASLGWTAVLPAPLVTLWLAKDVALILGTYWHVKAQIPDATRIWQVIDPVSVPLQVHPTITSKVNTALQFATLATALYVGPTPILTTLTWITGATTVLSVASYLDYGAFQPNKKKKKQQHEE